MMKMTVCFVFTLLDGREIVLFSVLTGNEEFLTKATATLREQPGFQSATVPEDAPID